MSDQQNGDARFGREVREAAIDRLCEAFADDRLPMEEFERRLELAHRAETTSELRSLLDDLPDEARAVAQRPSAPTAPAPRQVARPPTPSRVPQRSIVAGILGGGSRSGGWIPARTNIAVGVMGGVSLDFRESPLAGVTTVQCYALWGGIEIVAPPGVHVDCSGIGILGGFDYRQEEAPTDPDAPVLRITGVAMMGGVDVSVREPGESVREAKRRKRALKKARRRARRLEE